MANPLRALDIVLRAKRRKLEKLEAAVVQHQAHLQSCRDQHAQAQQQEQACRHEETQCGLKIDALSRRAEGFLPADIVTLRHVLDTLAELTRGAAGRTLSAAQQVKAAEEGLAAARGAVQRAQQRLEQLMERREKLARSMEQAQEDAQDEESEEAAVARLVAARRDEDAQRQPARG